METRPGSASSPRELLGIGGQICASLSWAVPRGKAEPPRHLQVKMPGVFLPGQVSKGRSSELLAAPSQGDRGRRYQEHLLPEERKSSVGGSQLPPRGGDGACHFWKGKGRSVLLMENALGF